MEERRGSLTRGTRRVEKGVRVVVALISFAAARSGTETLK
jgi:hypothetical protein